MALTLTEKATGRLKEIIATKGEDLALRVVVRSGGCSGLEYGMALERSPRADDALFSQDGVKIVVDPASLEFLDGSSIDFVDQLMGGGFAIHNPNATQSCGCGQSFKTAEHQGQAKSCGSCGQS